MTEKEGKEREYEHNNKRKAENMCLYELSLVFYFCHPLCLYGLDRALFDEELP